MTLFIISLVLAALFAAADQVERFAERFYNRRFTWMFGWDTGLRFPFPFDSEHTYQGAKIWLLAIAWYVAPDLAWYWFIGIMIGWYQVRNLFLHVVLTKDWI